MTLGELYELERAGGVVVLGAKLPDGVLDLLLVEGLVGARDLVGGERCVGREQYCLDDLLDVHSSPPSSATSWGGVSPSPASSRR
jgi:hypothetical protein